MKRVLDKYGFVLEKDDIVILFYIEFYVVEKVYCC